MLAAATLRGIAGSAPCAEREQEGNAGTKGFALPTLKYYLWKEMSQWKGDEQQQQQRRRAEQHRICVISARPACPPPSGKVPMSRSSSVY